MTWGLIVFAVLLGLIPAKIAERKGGSFLEWWVYGTVLWIVAFPLALMKKDRRYGACPWCAEDLRVEARVCPHCQREVTPLGADGEPDYSAHA